MAKRPREIEVTEVLERFDPDIDVEADSDPTYDMKFDPESHEGKELVWVHKDDVNKYKFSRHEIAKGGPDAPRLLCGATYADGEDITSREMTLMTVDADYIERRRTAQRRSNKELRARMLKNANRTKFVNYPGMPGR